MDTKTSFYPEGLKELQIYLLDIRPSIVEVWKKFFQGFPNVKIINLPFNEFMDIIDDEPSIYEQFNEWLLNESNKNGIFNDNTKKKKGKK